MNQEEIVTGINQEKPKAHEAVYDNKGLRVRWNYPGKNTVDQKVIAGGTEYVFNEGVGYLVMVFREDLVKYGLKFDSEILLEGIEALADFIRVTEKNPFITDETVVFALTNNQMYRLTKRLGFETIEENRQKREIVDGIGKLMIYSKIGKIREALNSEEMRQAKETLEKRVSR